LHPALLEKDRAAHSDNPDGLYAHGGTIAGKRLRIKDSVEVLRLKTLTREDMEMTGFEGEKP
jgi:hypothetical protein